MLRPLIVPFVIPLKKPVRTIYGFAAIDNTSIEPTIQPVPSESESSQFFRHRAAGKTATNTVVSQRCDTPTKKRD
jgi:hypothetical protein